MATSHDITRAAHALLGALALTSLGGCAHHRTSPPPPSPPAATATAGAPAPGASPSTAAPPSATPPPASAPPAGTRAPAGASAQTRAPRRPATAGPAPPAAHGPAAAPVPAPAPTPAASAGPPALNLTSLEQRLRDTHAIGVFTKLSLKNQVDDLLAQFRDFYTGKGALTLTQLRRSYELLLMKVVTLLQDDDPGLASAVASSREAIWGILSNRTTFNNL